MSTAVLLSDYCVVVALRDFSVTDETTPPHLSPVFVWSCGVLFDTHRRVCVVAVIVYLQLCDAKDSTTNNSSSRRVQGLMGIYDGGSLT